MSRWAPSFACCVLQTCFRENDSMGIHVENTAWAAAGPTAPDQSPAGLNNRNATRPRVRSSRRGRDGRQRRSPHASTGRRAPPRTSVPVCRCDSRSTCSSQTRPRKAWGALTAIPALVRRREAPSPTSVQATATLSAELSCTPRVPRGGWRRAVVGAGNRSVLDVQLPTRSHRGCHRLTSERGTPRS